MDVSVIQLGVLSLDVCVLQHSVLSLDVSVLHQLVLYCRFFINNCFSLVLLISTLKRG